MTKEEELNESINKLYRRIDDIERRIVGQTGECDLQFMLLNLVSHHEAESRVRKAIDDEIFIKMKKNRRNDRAYFDTHIDKLRDRMSDLEAKMQNKPDEVRKEEVESKTPEAPEKPVKRISEREKWIDREFYRINHKPRLLASSCIVAPPGIEVSDYKFHRAETIADVTNFMYKHGAHILDYEVLPITVSNSGYKIFRIEYKHDLSVYTCLIEFSPNDLIFYYSGEFHSIIKDKLIETFEVKNE